MSRPKKSEHSLRTFRLGPRPKNDEVAPQVKGGVVGWDDGHDVGEKNSDGDPYGSYIENASAIVLA